MIVSVANLRMRSASVPAPASGCRELAPDGTPTPSSARWHPQEWVSHLPRSGSQAALEEDNTTGPGNEVWLHPSAEPGRYRVCYKLFSGSPSPAVRGSILWQEGKIEIPNLTLTQEDQVRIAVEVLVSEDGRISLDRSRTGQVLGTGGCR